MSFRHIVIVLELALLFIFFAPLPIVNAGNIFGIIVSLILIIITANWRGFKDLICKIWQVTGGKISLLAVSLLIVAGLIYVTVLSVNMYKAMRNKPEKCDIVVVLGCKVNGETPSRMLRRRLDAAYEYMDKNSDVMCIVSGGQGSDEAISEAQAMETYMLGKGIDKSRIIKEDQSTSTEENIENSMKILDELGLKHNITIVTDGFHQYRASLIAKKHGVNEVHAISAETEPRFIFTYWVREWFGIAKQQILG